ncbi:MAG: acyloxyacyl hydrolase [Deltaproteobacteria bacterium]|nr:acyloxyacyl hydrolase [Deltaproteobacteria bacterium]
MRTVDIALRVSVVVALLVTTSGRARAEESGLHVAETSVRFAGGVNPETSIQYYAIHGDIGFHLWEGADRWFSDHDISARWIVEPWAAFVSDQHGIHKAQSFEIGVSPLFGKLTYGEARLRPFVEGGEGILYTDLRKEHFGTRFQFSSQIGGGIEYEIEPGLAFTLAARLRHMSNAGLGGSNHGLNTYMGLIGLTFR